MLRAVGVNLGNRFIASKEAPGSEEWKQAIIHANSEDSIKVEILNDISPVPGAVGFGTVLRSLPTPFLDEWSEEARRDRDRLRGEILATHQAGRTTLCLLPGRLRAESKKSCRWRRYAPSRGRDRSGPIARRRLSLRPPRTARAVPGRRPARLDGGFTLDCGRPGRRAAARLSARNGPPP
jgi:hypothetical protein